MKISSAIRVALLALTAFAAPCCPPRPMPTRAAVADDLQGGNGSSAARAAAGV